MRHRVIALSAQVFLAVVLVVGVAQQANGFSFISGVGARRADICAAGWVVVWLPPVLNVWIDPRFAPAEQRAIGDAFDMWDSRTRLVANVGNFNRKNPAPLEARSVVAPTIGLLGIAAHEVGHALGLDHPNRALGTNFAVSAGGVILNYRVEVNVRNCAPPAVLGRNPFTTPAFPAAGLPPVQINSLVAMRPSRLVNPADHDAAPGVQGGLLAGSRELEAVMVDTTGTNEQIDHLTEDDEDGVRFLERLRGAPYIFNPVAAPGAADICVRLGLPAGAPGGVLGAWTPPAGPLWLPLRDSAGNLLSMTALTFDPEGKYIEHADIYIASGADVQEGEIKTDPINFGGILTVGVSGSIVHMNPRMATSIYERCVIGELFDDLVALDKNTLEPIPYLANSWEFLKSDQIRFYLNEGITFYNGEDLTAEDVAFSFNELHWVEKAIVVDTYTVDIFTREEHEPKEALSLCVVPILPKDTIEELGDEEFDLFPVGSGPYRFEGFEPGSRVRLMRNEDHWLVYPYLDQVVYKLFPNRSTMEVAFDIGDIDIIYYPFEETIVRARVHEFFVDPFGGFHLCDPQHNVWVE